MSFGRLRADACPAHEQEVGGPGCRHVAGVIGDDFSAIGESVVTLEGGGTVVHGDVAAERVGVTLRVIGWVKTRHHSRADATSLGTLAVIATVEHLTNHITRDKGEIRRALGEAAHEVRIPLRPEWNVHAHAIPFPNEPLLEITTHAI